MSIVSKDPNRFHTDHRCLVLIHGFGNYLQFHLVTIVIEKLKKIHIATSGIFLTTPSDLCSSMHSTGGSSVPWRFNIHIFTGSQSEIHTIERVPRIPSEFYYAHLAQ